MNIHVVMHEAFEAPGAIEFWAKNNCHVISYTRLYEGDVLPSSIDAIDFLIVLGGPQCPSTTTNECSHFDAIKEINFIKQAITGDKLLLGVCLGAQLIGEALGASFEKSPHKEIGVFPITLTSEASDDPFFSTCPSSFLVGHWHGDMPGLTEDAAVLASSEGCPRQIVRYAPKIYGFQCHFEFTLSSIEGMIEYCGHELTEHATSPFIQSAKELQSKDYSSFNTILFDFLDYMHTLL